jgi:hypothetical protein
MLVKRTPETLSGGHRPKPPKLEHPLDQDPVPFNHTLAAFNDSCFQNNNQHLNRANVPSLVKTESIEILNGIKPRGKDNKAAIIKRLLNTIEKVLMETERPNCIANIPVLNFKETDTIFNNRRLGQLPTFREKGYLRLLKNIKLKISDTVTAEHLSLGIEEKINNLKGVVLSEYLESIKSLSNELSKAGVKQADIIRIFQASESEIGNNATYAELILATIEGPQLFIF